MLVALAFCPDPPLLVPELAAGAAIELAQVRLACDEAVMDLLGARPDEVAVLGAGAVTREHPSDAGGSLRGFGVEVGTGDGDPVLPPSLTVGGWLLDRVRSTPPRAAGRAMLEVSAQVSGDQAERLGEALASRPGRTALLVMGDGSSGRTPKAPRMFDPRAIGFDDAVAAVLAAGDAVGLAGLDERLERALGVGGAAPWRVAAAAARVAAGRRWKGSLLAYEAPYGVGYFVATWLPA